MPGNNETGTLQVLTDLCGADDMNNFSVFQVSQSLKTVETTCKTSSLTTHRTHKNVESEEIGLYWQADSSVYKGQKKLIGGGEKERTVEKI
jgi:hypothetical protein